ncbi:MAG: sigma-70 family RNA polymerase sigma factor [Anaerolineae bacterium]|nr:sigma-70 family RNA polymerase sigma factor [Anaerolineae bacterium]
MEADLSDLSGLIERWRRGHQAAAEAIYNRCRGVTYGLAYVLLGDAADAEEVTQDSLTYALTHIDQYDPQRAKFSTWLHTITVSRCRNKRRRRFLPSVSFLAWFKGGGDQADPTPSPERQTLQHDIRHEVWTALQSLSQPLREAILLRYWADYTYPEISEILGCSARVARSRVLAAHEQLAPLLARDDLISLEESI